MEMGLTGQCMILDQPLVLIYNCLKFGDQEVMIFILLEGMAVLPTTTAAVGQRLRAEQQQISMMFGVFFKTE